MSDIWKIMVAVQYEVHPLATSVLYLNPLVNV